MEQKLIKLKLTTRKLKLSDFKQFKKLFYLTFKKKISYDFFKWRYFSDKYSFCYGMFNSSELIANVGMKSNLLNNNNYDRIYSRHTSMVKSNFRGKGVFSKLLKDTKNNFLKKTRLILMWPNKNNFASFGIKKERIIKTNYFLYKVSNYKTHQKKTVNFNIKNMKKFSVFFQNNHNFFYKDFNYYNNRYLLYKRKDYIINKFEKENLKSFFILKKNRDEDGLSYVVLDHFGSMNIQSIHLAQILREEKKVIIWSKKIIKKKNFKLLNKINLHIGKIKKIDMHKKNKLLSNKNFMIGDTDTFVTIN